MCVYISLLNTIFYKYCKTIISIELVFYPNIGFKLMNSINYFSMNLI